MLTRAFSALDFPLFPYLQCQNNDVVDPRLMRDLAEVLAVVKCDVIPVGAARTAILLSLSLHLS